MCSKPSHRPSSPQDTNQPSQDLGREGRDIFRLIIGHAKGKKRFVTRNALAANLKRQQTQKRITAFFNGQNPPLIRKVGLLDDKIQCFQANNQKELNHANF